MDNWEAVVGFEIHVELKTKSKMFCGCKNDPFFAKEPNSYTCPVCLGMPGGLPVPNRAAIEWVIKLGLALGCTIPSQSKFDRKNYFYPDLPKGYQISQYDEPLAVGGLVRVDGGDVRIARVHSEEDTGKLIHTTVGDKKVTLIDFNRSGVPLAEIVTEPDIKSGEHAKIFLKKLQQIIRYLDISDADMEKGSMRLEPNISVRKVKEKKLPDYKVEVKNLNSFNFVKQAIDAEVARQVVIIQSGEKVPQETRGWDEQKKKTFVQRSKEQAEDYRYFPDPDIPPMRFTKAYVAEIMAGIPELPDAKRERFIKKFGLSSYNASLLTETRERADYFEEAVAVGSNIKDKVSAKTIANWLINRKIDISETLPASLVEHIVTATHAVMISGDVEKIARQVIDQNAKAVGDFKKGKEQALMFLVGQVRRLTKGQADAAETKNILTRLIK